MAKAMTFRVLVVCGVISLCIFLVIDSRMDLICRPLEYLKLKSTPKSKSPVLLEAHSYSNKSVRVVTPGQNIQVGDLQIHITTAVFIENFPAVSGFNVFLNGWANHDEDMTFKCCFLHSLPAGDLESDVFIEAQAFLYHIYNQWIVDMQNAEFSCTISNTQLSEVGKWNITHVTFVKDSCFRTPDVVMEIVFPQRVNNSVGVCLKISYGSLDPEKVVEWFEYTKMMGVTKVFTYYFDLDPPAMRVLQYYNSSGFLQMLPIHPAKKTGGKDRGFRRPRYEQQAWVDEVMAANDCKDRMAGFDYVIVMDIDEYIVPESNMKTYFDILKATSDRFKNAGTFSFSSHVMMLDWGISRQSPLHVGQYTLRVKEANYDGFARNSRWGFRPSMTYFAQNNFAHPKKPFISTAVPSAFYKLFHFRSCKFSWKGCKDRSRVKDESMLKYERNLVDNILSLPLDKILPDNQEYVSKMRSWKTEQKVISL